MSKKYTVEVSLPLLEAIHECAAETHGAAVRTLELYKDYPSYRLRYTADRDMAQIVMDWVEEVKSGI